MGEAATVQHQQRDVAAQPHATCVDGLDFIHSCDLVVVAVVHHLALSLSTVSGSMSRPTAVEASAVELLRRTLSVQSSFGLRLRLGPLAFALAFAIALALVARTAAQWSVALV